MLKHRYDRNRILSPDQQEELASKRVAVIGCGGLGGYLVEMLGRMGVGKIVACDGDVFDETNLNRQLLATEDCLGQSKAKVAAERMKLVNQEVVVEPVAEFLTYENAKEVLGQCDLVLDGLDTVGKKLMLQKVCRELDLPMVHGAIGGWFGQVTTIFPGNDTLSLIYEEGQEVSQEEGNPSFSPAVVAGIQVSEAVKVLLGYEDVLMRKMLFLDLFENRIQVVEL